jgi:co-chaperonin GroES (HSP10)
MSFDPLKIKGFKALQDHVIVSNMNFDQKISHGGIIIQSTDGKLEGIHPRWGRVYAVGPKQRDIRVGQYVCVKHGRWTRGVEVEDSTGEHTLRRVDAQDILLVSDVPMNDETIGRGL